MRGLCLVGSLSSQQLIESVLTPVIDIMKEQLALRSFVHITCRSIRGVTMTVCLDHGQLSQRMLRP